MVSTQSGEKVRGTAFKVEVRRLHSPGDLQGPRKVYQSGTTATEDLLSLDPEGPGPTSGTPDTSQWQYHTFLSSSYLVTCFAPLRIACSITTTSHSPPIVFEALPSSTRVGSLGCRLGHPNDQEWRDDANSSLT